MQDGLRKEIKGLEDLNAHHPEVAKYRAENQKLKSEITQLNSLGKGVESMLSNKHYMMELEKVYKDLVESEKEPQRTPLHTPQSGDSVSVATIERHKSQNEKLQAEVETVRTCLDVVMNMFLVLIAWGVHAMI